MPLSSAQMPPAHWLPFWQLAPTPPGPPPPPPTPPSPPPPLAEQVPSGWQVVPVGQGCAQLPVVPVGMHMPLVQVMPVPQSLGCMHSTCGGALADAVKVTEVELKLPVASV